MNNLYKTFVDRAAEDIAASSSDTPVDIDKLIERLRTDLTQAVCEATKRLETDNPSPVTLDEYKRLCKALVEDTLYTWRAFALDFIIWLKENRNDLFVVLKNEYQPNLETEGGADEALGCFDGHMLGGSIDETNEILIEFINQHKKALRNVREAIDELEDEDDNQ
ncbi:hypothetical protein KJ652_07300 [Patescibacteria group bacterium]|nr:hypothetical protein [Patescibacteria group bacterium]MBU1124354.1 hypothetical protein [Patescibacteria group bacterium]